MYKLNTEQQMEGCQVVKSRDLEDCQRMCTENIQCDSVDFVFNNLDCRLCGVWSTARVKATDPTVKHYDAVRADPGCSEARMDTSGKTRMLLDYAAMTRAREEPRSGRTLHVSSDFAYTFCRDQSHRAAVL